jgi:hypothetical protein
VHLANVENFFVIFMLKNLDRMRFFFSALLRQIASLSDKCSLMGETEKPHFEKSRTQNQTKK